MKNNIYLILITLIFACKPTLNEPLVFRIPEVVNTANLDTADIVKPRTLYNGEFPVEIGPFSFKDSIIDLSADIIWDTNQIIEVGIESSEYLETKLRNIKFQIIPDYNQTLFYKYKNDVTTVYPVFIVNSTNESQIFQTHSTYSCASEYYYGDREEDWISIESIGSSSFSFCGCCSGYFDVYPKQYFILLFPKYDTGQWFDFVIKMDRFQAQSEPFCAYLDTSLFHPVENKVFSDGRQRLLIKHDTNNKPIHY